MELQDAGYGTAGDYRVSWLNTVSKRLDTNLFKAENPEMYDKYAKESSSRRFIVKHIVEIVKLIVILDLLFYT